MSKSSLLTNAALTAELRKLADEVVDIDPAGSPITRRMILAKQIWDQAIGWVERTRDDNGTLVEIKHKPIGWCQQFMWERLEGRAVVAAPETGGGVRAADKVRGLARERLNALAKKVSGPPPHRPKAPVTEAA